MPCRGPDRVPVRDALDVVPHPVAVDQLRAGRLGDAEHPAVDVRGHAGDHVARRRCRAAPASCCRTRSWLPPMPPEATITACARSSKSPITSRELASPRATSLGLEDRAGDAVDGAVGDGQLVDAVAERERRRRPRVGRRAHPALERLDDAGAGAPGDVEARHRVAVAVGVVAAALGPADHREEPHALAVQPGALLAGREVDVGLGPLPRPVVLVPVEAGGAEPVLPARARGESLMPQPALLGRVDEEQPAERPERLAAEGLLGLLVEQDDALARRRPARPRRPAPPARRRRR